LSSVPAKFSLVSEKLRLNIDMTIRSIFNRYVQKILIMSKVKFHIIYIETGMNVYRGTLVTTPCPIPAYNIYLYYYIKIYVYQF